jgi:Protein of unknown function (DUF4232)
MSKAIRRTAAAIGAALALGIGSAVWVTSSASAAPAAPAAAAVPASPAIPPVCTAGDLAVWVGHDAMSGAAGTWYYPLEFTNTSNLTCRTWGWAGVSAVNANGRQLGNSATRNHLYRPAWVNIAPGATAHALLGYGAAEVSTSGCRAQNASVLKVYPPSSKTARHAFFDLPVCAVGGLHAYLSVSVIQPGTNI